MTSSHLVPRRRLPWLACALIGTAAAAPSNQAPPTQQERPAAPPAGQPLPSVVKPPRNIDPGMVTPPPQPTSPSMPVIKPPAPAR